MDRVEIRDETIFTLLRLPAARTDVRDWWVLAALTVIGWLGAVAFLGGTGPDPMARTLYAVASPEMLSYAAVALALASAAPWPRCASRVAGTALMVAAFLAAIASCRCSIRCCRRDCSPCPFATTAMRSISSRDDWRMPRRWPSPCWPPGG